MNNFRKKIAANSARLRVLELSITLTFFMLFSGFSIAMNDREDFDVDDDGLIEIFDLQDLDEIRNHTDGRGLYGSSEGCPQNGCFGFELMQSLDFDTNGDGIVGEADQYWNDGLGWIPISSAEQEGAFKAIFEGNGFAINNLSSKHITNSSLFLKLENAQIRNLALTNIDIYSQYYSSGLAIYTNNSEIIGCYVTGTITSRSISAGFVVDLNNSRIAASFTQLIFSSDSHGAGGIASFASDSTVEGTYSIVYANAPTQEHKLALIAFDPVNSDIRNNYFVGSQSSSENNAFKNISLYSAIQQLQCPTSANDSNCGDSTLYQGWDKYKNQNDETYWYFGTDAELPSLNYQNLGMRDSDADSIIDSKDAFPTNFAAALDSDGDGFPAYDDWTPSCIGKCREESGLITDQFPNTPAAYLDLDLDGLPDHWAPNCDALCQQNSGFELDDSINDTDNDGIPNNIDEDDDGDGLQDIDADSDGLIDIRNLADLANIDQVRDGSGILVNNELINSGCPISAINGTPEARCFGYELVNNLDFDTNNDGKLNAQDEYWQDGKGWTPITLQISPSLSGEYPITVFDGNGHLIKNLYINGGSNHLAGLFRSISYAEIRNLGLTGPHFSVKSNYTAGGLAARSYRSYIHSVFSLGDVEAGTTDFRTNANAGGLLGNSDKETIIENVFTSGSVKSIKLAAGIAVGATVKNSFSIARIMGEQIWPINSNENFNNSFWLQGKIEFPMYVYQPNMDFMGGITGEDLKCFGLSNHESCNYQQLSTDWNSEIWNFGNLQTYPGLKINDHIYRDSDGDGVLDNHDKFPLNYAAAVDEDSDGAPDRWNGACDKNCRESSQLVLDQFLNNSAAAIDLDHDGYVDEWPSGCDSNCQVNSSVTLDTHLNDSDNDGINNEIDSDDNGDGVKDADSDSDGLIDLYNVDQLNAIRFNLSGYGLQLSIEGIADHSGCPGIIENGVWQAGCRGYELMNNIDLMQVIYSQADIAKLSNNEPAKDWVPIGNIEQNMAFRGIFEGNGFKILNLSIDAKQKSDNEFESAALFSYLNGAEIRNLHIEGPQTIISGGGYSAILAGKVENSTLKGNSVVGSVTFKRPTPYKSSYISKVGGLAAEAKYSLIESSKADVNIINGYGGALISNIEQTLIKNSYTHGKATRASNFVIAGQRSTIVNSYTATRSVDYFQSNTITNGTPLSPNNIGSSSFNSEISISVINSYWADDLVISQSTQGSGVPLAQLKCPINANDNNCATSTLYQDWQHELNDQNNPIWIFGNNQQLPRLYFEETYTFDSDGDGIDDIYDDFPMDDRIAEDRDKDGIADTWTDICDLDCRENAEITIDHFPSDIAASVDLDFDHLPDYWNERCDQQCQSNSNLQLDPFLNDRDNDGINDTDDDDDNNDGIIDVDSDSDGLIEIRSMDEFFAIRENLLGWALGNKSRFGPNTSGCPASYRLVEFMPACKGYELMIDIDFNQFADRGFEPMLPWEPLGSSHEPFSAIFNGNGHVIKNLYVYGPDKEHQGFFGVTRDAEILNIGFEGNDTVVTGKTFVGGIVGTATNTKFKNCYFSGQITALEKNAAGIVGNANNVSIENCYVTGSVITLDWPNAATDNYIGPFATKLATSGDPDRHFQISSSYYSAIINQQNHRNIDLACPTATNREGCNQPNQEMLFLNWPIYNPLTGEGLWDLGSNQDLPRLVPQHKTQSSSQHSQSASSSSAATNETHSSSSETSNNSSSSSSATNNEKQGGSLHLWLIMWLTALLILRKKLRPKDTSN